MIDTIAAVCGLIALGVSVLAYMSATEALRMVRDDLAQLRNRIFKLEHPDKPTGKFL